MQMSLERLKVQYYLIEIRETGMERLEQSKYWKFLFIAVIAIQVGVMIYWGNMKSGYYWDEFFTFDNAHYSSSTTPTRVKLYDADFMEYDKWFELSELKGTLTVTRENSLLNDSLSYNINKFWKGRAYRDVLLNYVEAIFFPGELNKWSAISINIVLFVLNQLILYQLVKGITGRKIIALFSVMMYGFSGMAISMTIFIRFYMWVTTLFTVFIFCHMLIWKEDNIWKCLCYIVVAGLSLLLCFKEQPIVVFAGVGFIGSFAIILLICKKYKKCIQYLLPIVGGGSIYLIFFTSYLQEVFQSGSLGVDASNSSTLFYLSKAKDLDLQELISRCKMFIQIVNRYLFGHSIILAIFLLLMMGLIFYVNLKKRSSNLENKVPLFMWSIVGAILIFAVVSVCIRLADTVRYNSFIFPLLAICVVTFLFQYGRRAINERAISILILGLIIIQVYFTFTIPRIDNVYYEDKEEVEKIHQIENIDSVVVDYYLDDKVMYECLAYGDVSTKVIFKKSSSINFDECGEEFLLWQSVNHGLDIENDLVNAGYTSIKEIAQTHESRVYLCTKGIQ